MNWFNSIVGLTGVGATLAGVNPSAISDATRIANTFAPATPQQGVGNATPQQNAAQRAAALPGWAQILLWAGGGVVVLLVGKALLK